MANMKVLNKDPFTYAEERRRFLEDLRRFHTTRGTLFDRIPQIGGREVDLYGLYRTVTDLGGWQKANNDLLWEDIEEDFGVPVACTNGAQALKYIYYRYLTIYEKVHFLGLDADNCSDEQEDGPARKKICLPVELIPLTYNYNQHKVPDAQRENGQLSADLIRMGDYEKLEMSLRSGLPNEVDFAVNVCLLLSNEGRYVLKLNKSIHLLTLLLANIGIFEEGSGTMEDVMLDSWRNSESKRDFLRFWHDIVKDEKMREIVKTKAGIYKRDEMVGSEVLHLGRELGVRDAEGQRVSQLAMLIRNLSFEEINQQLLASNSLVFRFLMLCAHSSYSNLRQLALDTLGNMAAQMVLQPAEAVATQLILNLIKKSLVDLDKFVVVRALEMLSKLCQLERNESVVIESLAGETYASLVQLLLVHDIQLIVHTLEALYQLSELGETTTTSIAGVKQAVDMLVNLITVEAQSYGPNSLMGIKVVEYVPPADPSAPHHPSMPPPSRTVLKCMPPGHGPGFPVQPSSHMSAADQARSDVETTASNWLQGTYETKKGSVTKQNDLFAEYQQFCCKFGIADTLTATDIVNIAKAAIPQAKVAEVDRGEGHKETVLKGLSKRAKPKPFAIRAGSDKVDKSPACSVPVNSLRGPAPGSANWPFPSQHLGHAPPSHTPTLRQRLMEPPLPQPFMNYAGATGAGVPPSARPRGQQGTTSRSGGGGGKKRAPASPAQPSGPGPGPGGKSTPQPGESGIPAAARPVLMPHQQLQVAGAPQPASSVLGGGGGGEQVLIQSSSSSPLLKAGTVLPPSFAHPASPFSSASLTVCPVPPGATASSMSPGQQFPTIHQALQGEMAGKASVPGTADDTVFIKSLLAKKVCQNMVRQGNITPPPHESQPDSAGGDHSVLQAQPAMYPQQVKPQHQADQPVLAGPNRPHHHLHQQFPHMMLAPQQSSSVQQQGVQTSMAQQHQLQQFPQQAVRPALVHQHAQTPAEQHVAPQLVASMSQTVLSAAVQQHFRTPEQFAQPPRSGAHPVLIQQQPVSSQLAHQHMQGAHLQLQAQLGQQQQASAQPEAQRRTPTQHLLPHQQPGVPAHQFAQQVQQGVASQFAQQQQAGVPSQFLQQFSQQQQLTGQSPLAQHQQNGQSQTPTPPHLSQPQVMMMQQQQTAGVLSQPQSLQKPPLMSAAEQRTPQQIQSQLAPAQPIPNRSQLVPAQPPQPQGNQSQLQHHQAQSQQTLLHVHQGQPAQNQSLSQGVQTLEGQSLSQGLQLLPQQMLLQAAAQPGQPVQNQSLSQGVQTPPAHGAAHMVSAQAQTGPSQLVQPSAQPMVQVAQGQPGMVHQQGQGQIHIQQRGPGPQQMVVQGSPQQSLQLKPGQQNHVLIQGQHILHQQLHLQPNQPVQGQLPVQGQRLQSPSGSQPVVIQRPMYQMPSQMAGCASPSLPPTLGQTPAGGVAAGQSPMAPYRALHPPHQSPSGVAALSSHRGAVPGTVSSGAQTLVGAQPGQDALEARATRDWGDGGGVCASSQTVTVQSGGGPLGVCVPPSQTAISEGRTVILGPAPSVPPAPPMHWSAAATLPSSSSALIPHPAAAASSSSSLSLHPSLSCTPSSSLSIAQALLSGQEAQTQTAGSTNPPPPALGRPCAESQPHPYPHPHPAREHGHTNGSRKDCNGLGGVVNGGLGSPDSASNDLPPSPMGRGKGGQQDPLHFPNGLLEGIGWKEGALPLSKELLHSMAEKMSKLNGVTPHHSLENGDAKISVGNNTDVSVMVDQDSLRRRESGEMMEVDSPHRKAPEVWQHVNGLSGLGNKESQGGGMAGPSRLGQGLVKQTSMEEVSLDSTDSRLVVNCSGTRTVGLEAGVGVGVGMGMGMGVGVRPLFSPNSSHDSDVSCDSFASSLADSVSSDKHSLVAPIFPRPISAPSPSPSSSSCSVAFPEAPLVLAGTVSKSEAAANKKGSKKKAPPTPKPKVEKAPPKSKKRKGGKNAPPESPNPPVPAVPLVMVYMCEWAGCGRCFDNARLVYLHASKTHVPPLPEGVCQWHGCEPLRRKRWSLVTHLQDHHCSEMAQRAACQRRFQAAQTAATSSSQTPTPLHQAPALVYPPDAAMQAIKRFHIKPPFAEFADMREGPVTKHIRLTAALILRNLARYSAVGRSLIKHRERQLSYVSMSMCESSTALSSCLWEILHDT